MSASSGDANSSAAVNPNDPNAAVKAASVGAKTVREASGLVKAGKSLASTTAATNTVCADEPIATSATVVLGKTTASNT